MLAFFYNGEQSISHNASIIQNYKFKSAIVNGGLIPYLWVSWITDISLERSMPHQENTVMSSEKYRFRLCYKIEGTELDIESMRRRYHGIAR